MVRTKKPTGRQHCASFSLLLIVEFIECCAIFQRAMKSRRFYKGENVEPEKAEFLPESPDDEYTRGMANDDDNKNKSIRERLSSELKKFQNPQAKKAFFIAFTSIIMGFFCGVWFLVTYVTDIFNKTGSSLSDKNSSLLISFATLFTNLVFLNIVERFNRRVCIH